MAGVIGGLLDIGRGVRETDAVSQDALERCLTWLRCPLSGEPLSRLTSDEVATVNGRLHAREWRHHDGSEAPKPLTVALGTADRQWVYRVDDGIVWLLGDLALGAMKENAATALAPEKRVVREFYDDFGWVKDEQGQFKDTTVFTEVRPEVEGYRRACNARIGRWLTGGDRLLDVASGAIPHPEYLDYSAGYTTRICVDFSVRALREAQVKLGDRGLYVLGDITRLPLADGAVDAVISLHTIYHVPVQEQTKAVDELVRVVKPGGRVVIAYTWAHSPAMNGVFRLRGALGWLRRGGRSPEVASPAETESRALYFHPQNYEWYARDVAARHGARLRVWSAVSMVFQNRFFTNNALGRWMIRAVLLGESTCPRLAGRWGQYPLFVIDRASARGRGGVD